MPGISSTRGAARWAMAQRVSQAFMVRSRSVWGAVMVSALVRRPRFSPEVSSSKR